MDLRRERELIVKSQGQYGRMMGTTVRWATYDASTSTEDPLYDDGGGIEGRQFLRLISVPVLWIDNIEGHVNQTEYRTDKSDDVRMGVSLDQMRAAGVPDVTNDDAHVRDIFYWIVKNQWYRVDDWEVMGQHAADFVVIGITGVQIWPDEEYLSEAFPPNGPAPVS